MKTLIVCNSESMSERIRSVLARDGLECPSGHAVRLDLAADRARRMLPELILLVLPDDVAAGMESLRETCQTVKGGHVVVLGPVDDSRLILRTLHEGADEYLDIAALDNELAAALTRIKARRSDAGQARRAGRIIGILGASGGSGSSMLAVNLAAQLARKHGGCGLIDLRLEAGDLTAMLDLKPRHTLADFCQRLARVDLTMFEQFFAPHESGVQLLAAPARLAEAQQVTEKGVRRAVTLAGVRFPYVVLDLDSRFSAAQVEALWQADVLLLVLRLDYTSVRNTRRVMDQLEQLGIDMGRVELVANAYRQRKQLSYRQAEAALGRPLTHYIPNDPARVHRAINKGVPVSLYYPSANISRRIADMAASVNGFHTPEGGKG